MGGLSFLCLLLKRTNMTLHKEGTVSILLVFAAVLALNVAGHYLWSQWLIANILTWAVSLFLVVIILQFFRKPFRTPVVDAGAIMSPCDGKVVVIEEVDEPEFLNERRIQVSIFMSPLNVHINWFPVAGTVKYAKYHPGKYLVAWHPKSSTENERTTVVVEPDGKPAILFRQIAGALARRIVYYCKANDAADQGGEMGFIKFGSRVDLFLPLDADIKVKIGEKVTGTQTIVALYK